MHEIFVEPDLNKKFLETITKIDFEFIDEFNVKDIKLSKYNKQFEELYMYIKSVMIEIYKLFDGHRYLKTLKILLFKHFYSLEFIFQNESRLKDGIKQLISKHLMRIQEVKQLQDEDQLKIIENNIIVSLFSSIILNNFWYNINIFDRLYKIDFDNSSGVPIILRELYKFQKYTNSDRVLTTIFVLSIIIDVRDDNGFDIFKHINFIKYRVSDLTLSHGNCLLYGEILQPILYTFSKKNISEYNLHQRGDNLFILWLIKVKEIFNTTIRNEKTKNRIMSNRLFTTKIYNIFLSFFIINLEEYNYIRSMFNMEHIIYIIDYDYKQIPLIDILEETINSYPEYKNNIKLLHAGIISNEGVGHSISCIYHNNKLKFSDANYGFKYTRNMDSDTNYDDFNNIYTEDHLAFIELIPTLHFFIVYDHVLNVYKYDITKDLYQNIYEEMNNNVFSFKPIMQIIKDKINQFKHHAKGGSKNNIIYFLLIFFTIITIVIIVIIVISFIRKNNNSINQST